jgi:hypothetical protein
MYEGTENQETRFIYKFCSISMLLDPDLHSQYEYGSRTAKSMWIHANPQHCLGALQTSFPYRVGNNPGF